MHASSQRGTLRFDALVGALEAIGETTRLRLVALLGDADLTVSELVAILGQSQPRVSRHLKLLVEAGLAERQREGAWAFFRLTERGALLGKDLLSLVASDDASLGADRMRLDMTREARRRQAASYFAERAADWDSIRALHAPEASVEDAILAAVRAKPFRTLLDLGTGTGRMLELAAPLAERAVGVDQSPAMLALARSRLEQAGVRNVQLRHGDIYAPPVEPNAYDLVIMHQVLHFLDDPARAIREAAHALRPGGRLIIVDFAAHDEESLRSDFAHRRLGFANEEIASFLEAAGLPAPTLQIIPPAPGAAGKLTVSVWLAQDPRIQSDDLIPSTARIA